MRYADSASVTRDFPTYPEYHPTPNPPRSSRLRVLVVVSIAVVVLLISGIAWWSRGSSSGTTNSGEVTIADSSVRAPAGERILVRVVNATKTNRLARRATLLLRDYGYDVVDFDYDPVNLRSATVIEVNTGKSELGERLQRILGVGRLEAHPDTLRYVDLTVFLGDDWTPPSQPFRP